MRTLFLVFLGLVAASAAHAQPWRVVKNGRVIYTSNIEDLPPEARARVLEKWRDKNGKIVPPRKEVPAEATPETDPDRFPKVGPDALKGDPTKPGDPNQPGDAKDGAKPDIFGAGSTDPRAEAAAKAADLANQLTAARDALDQARRKALEVPDGRNYEERNQAEDRVRELESELSAARVRAGLDP